MNSARYRAITWGFALMLSAVAIPSNAAGTATAMASSPPDIAFKKEADRLEVSIGRQIVATYVYDDPAIPRPYFCQVKTLEGILVTRPNPPDPILNKGNDDHPSFHPGIWLAFGDVNGKDYWRNKANVRHCRFIEPFIEEPGFGRFSVVNIFENDNRQMTPVCEETCTFTFHVSGTGYFLLIQSIFHSSNGDVAFGDQEEMGFGVRMNTPLTVKFGSGMILNDQGSQYEKGTWGQQSKWCAYWGIVNGHRAGVALMPASKNFRLSWFHTRDYGLMVANAFAKKAMTGPENAAMPPDSTVIKKKDPFSLGCGVYVFDGPADKDLDLTQAYNVFLTLEEKK